MTPRPTGARVLPSAARLRRSSEFATAVRSGRRAGRRLLSAYISLTDAETPARVGFVVGRLVGGAVVRNRVRRRLRHLMAPRVRLLPRGAVLVIRAHAGSAGARSDVLAAELESVLVRLGVTARAGPAMPC